MLPTCSPPASENYTIFRLITMRKLRSFKTRKCPRVSFHFACVSSPANNTQPLLRRNLPRVHVYPWCAVSAVCTHTAQTLGTQVVIWLGAWLFGLVFIRHPVDSYLMTRGLSIVRVWSHRQWVFSGVLIRTNGTLEQRTNLESAAGPRRGRAFRQ
jgi:hypothetical protein